jgi:hypothetical protein
LAHRGDERCDGSALVWSQGEITEDGDTRVVIQEGEVIRGAIAI